MKNSLLKVLGPAIWLALVASQGQAQAVPDIAQDCLSCHAIEETLEGLEERMTRQAPPLHYAGNKFQQDWLVAWLQDPQRLRPAGDYPAVHTVTDGGEDTIDESTLIEHPALDAEQATVVADWLMTLKSRSELIAVEAEDAYEPSNVNPRLGEMDFVKFKGCGGCHKDVPDYGGFSGPELYTAAQRLQPEYMISYIRNPQAWETYSLMPNKGLLTAPIHKLVDYLHILGEE